jgi:hypothetical protein
MWKPTRRRHPDRGRVATVSITLDEPLPDGTLILDGFDPNRDADGACRKPGPGQRVGDAPPRPRYPFG